MKHRYLTGTLALALVGHAAAQPAFTNGTSLLGHAANSGGCMAVVDMDGDGLDDVVQLHNSTHVYILYQEADGSFTTVDYGTVSGGQQWGWAAGDLDHDGHKDIISGGSSDGTHLLRISARGTYTLEELNVPTTFQQNMSVADVNNDGRVDIMACNDVGPPRLLITDQNGVPQFTSTYIDWTTNPASDMSGNYGSCFMDFNNDGHLDFYIAKCRQGVNNPDDPRRWNRLFVNDGNNNYTDMADVYGVQDHEQTWASDFGDFDNDGDLDLVSIEHSTGIQLFENDGTGHFTNVTVGSGLGTTSFPLQCLFRDLDNDGFLDILIAGGSEFFYRGHGDGTFTLTQGLFPYSKAMHSFAFGDLDRDGFEDVYANYGNSYVSPSAGNPDILWLNTPNGNHFFRVRLKGSTSNPDAIGARVTITGPWGTQVREVRSGESYGLINSFILQFGLGMETVIPTMTVRWPSGLEESFTGLNADQTITVVEGSCISPNVAITGNPATTLCTGSGPITLTASASGDLLWNTGATGTTIDVGTPGNYYVTAGTGDCMTQANLNVMLDPDETPVITAQGPVDICPNDQVVLASSPAPNYAWSNGGTGQAITVNTPGDYTVSVQGACALFSSDTITVNVLDAAGAPQSDDVTIPVAGTAVLTATGDSIRWYDAAADGTLLGSGSPWTTPWVETADTFWCSATLENGGGIAYGGMTNKTNNGVFQSNATYYLLFSTTADMVIKSVKVYANGAGIRPLALVDRVTDAVVYSGDFDIPDGESRVDLNWTVPANGSYGLRVASGNPQLWRDGVGSNPDFPYNLGNLGAITGSNAGSAQYYYFFYDWEVSAPATWCEGPRTAVHVYVGTTSVDDVDGGSPMHLFPNPALDQLTIGGELPPGAYAAEFIDVSGRVCLTAGLRPGGTTVDVSALAPGAYTVRIRGGQAVANAAFVKQ